MEKNNSKKKLSLAKQRKIKKMAAQERKNIEETITYLKEFHAQLQNQYEKDKKNINESYNQTNELIEELHKSSSAAPTNNSNNQAVTYNANDIIKLLNKEFRVNKKIKQRLSDKNRDLAILQNMIDTCELKQSDKYNQLDFTIKQKANSIVFYSKQFKAETGGKIFNPTTREINTNATKKEKKLLVELPLEIKISMYKSLQNDLVSCMDKEYTNTLNMSLIFKKRGSSIIEPKYKLNTYNTKTYTTRINTPPNKPTGPVTSLTNLRKT